jgi:uncharacterized cofD-like protein
MKNIPQIVVIGGGTGSYVVLSGLKDKGVELSAIVTMMDAGGSTGRLKDQLGVLPPGDVRQALVALSESSDLWRKIFTYRFDNGDLGGHNFGNIFLSALEKVTGSTKQGLIEASNILNIRGNVVPITYSKCTLCARYEDGSLVKGEDKIDSSYTKRPRIQHMYLEPEGILNPEIIPTIEKADVIVFAPGDIYTSLFPNLLVKGFVDVLAKSKAKKIYIANLMTKLGQTDGFYLSDLILELDKYLGGSFLDYVLVNNKKPSSEILSWYKEADNVSWIDDDLYDKRVVEATIIRGDYLSDATYVQNSADSLKRSLIRHDQEKLANAIIKLIDNR